MTEFRTQLADLTLCHPDLQWDDIAPAAAAVLSERRDDRVVGFSLDTMNLPLFTGSRLQLQIELTTPDIVIERIRRTFESSRLIELAAIAVTGLAIYHAGGHELRDVAYRGSSVDYLVDDSHTLLEIAGRSRRSDLEAAWQMRHQRLKDAECEFYYLSVCEFETMSGRLGYFTA